MTLGGPGHDGDLLVRSSDDVETVHINGEHGNMTLGGPGHDGDLFVKASNEVTTVHIDGEAGDIALSNADFAEEFDISESEEIIEPGAVMVLDMEGKLRQSTEPYDRKVAGVLSGAGDYRPAIILDKRHSQNKRLPIALNGKVYCKVEAHSSPIEIGDLLTTSETPGHAMKANDPSRAFGAVIGKALRPLLEGDGMIPILVSLQ